MKIFGTASTKTSTQHGEAESATRGSLLTQAAWRLAAQFLGKSNGTKAVVDTQIIQNQRLSHESIASAKQTLQTRALPLEAHFGEQALFHFNSVKLTKHVQHGTTTYTEILKPGHVAKLVLAHLYRTKNDVQIYIQKNDQSAEDLGNLITKKIEQHKEEPFGLVLFCRPLGAYIDPDQAPQDYEGHVTPVIIQKTAKGFDVINLDSVGDFNSKLVGAIVLQRNAGKNIRQLWLQEPRQADRYSCHTDAIQILKDSMIEHQFHDGNLFDRYFINFADRNSRFEESNDYLIDLPPFLQKTSQRSSALKVSSYTPESLSSTPVPGKNQRKGKTVAEHRDRFLTHVDDAHQINSFLLVKGYRNAFKVLEQLEKKSTAEAKAKYFQTIQDNHQLDF